MATALNSALDTGSSQSQICYMDINMKDDWNRRAKESARHYIATSTSPEDFDRSGESDVRSMFLEIEHIVTPESRVLDIGCGIGRMDQFVAPQVKHLTGVDVSGEMIQQAKERMDRFDNVNFVEGDGWTLPFPDDSFDLVFSHIVFQHMPRKVASSYFAEVRRVLIRGGNFVFQMPEINEKTPEDPPDDDSFEMRFYDEKELKAQLETLGFVWESCKRFEAGVPEMRFNQLRIQATL